MRTEFASVMLRQRFKTEVILDECAVILEPAKGEYELSIVQNPFVLRYDDKNPERDTQGIPPFDILAGVNEKGEPIYSDISYATGDEVFGESSLRGTASLEGELGWTGFFIVGEEVELYKTEGSGEPLIAGNNEPAGKVLYGALVTDPLNWPSDVEESAIKACEIAEAGSPMMGFATVVP